MDYNALATTFNKLSLEQLREVNRLVCNQINHLHKQKQQVAMTRFKVGDLVTFTSDKFGRKVTARVEALNQKTLSARETDGIGTKWRVSPGMCRLVGA